MLKALPRLLIALLLPLLLMGCGSRATSPEFQVASGRYAAAFDATRDVLRDYRFQLERVDAQQGVITTQPKPTAGLVSLWDKEQSTLKQEMDDVVNSQTRVVRITFANAAGTPTPLDDSGPVKARVEVTIYRRQSPGVRASSRAIALTTTTTDPEAVAQSIGTDYDVPVTQDSRLAARLALQIEQRLLEHP